MATRGHRAAHPSSVSYKAPNSEPSRRSIRRAERKRSKILGAVVLALSVGILQSPIALSAQASTPSFNMPEAQQAVAVCPGGERLVRIDVDARSSLLMVFDTSSRKVVRRHSLRFPDAVALSAYCADKEGRRVFIFTSRGPVDEVDSRLIRVTPRSKKVLDKGSAATAIFAHDRVYLMSGGVGDHRVEVFRTSPRRASRGDQRVLRRPLWADVTSYGARPGDAIDDTVAIQAANDALRGRRGIVFFPPGTYEATGVVQDSGVYFVGSKGAVIKQPAGESHSDMIASRVVQTNGSVKRGSTKLVLDQTRGIERGAIVGIQGAGAPSDVQVHSLAENITADQLRIKLTSVAGLASVGGYLRIENEIIWYGGVSGSSIVDVQRGRLGSEPSDHLSGANVSQATRHLTEVTKVHRWGIEIRDPAPFGVQDAAVQTGALDLGVVGLTLDGNRSASPSQDQNTFLVRYLSARWATIRGNDLLDGDHGGIILSQGTADSRIVDNDLRDHGDPENKLGSAVWLFRGAERNVVVANRIGGANFLGITMDDRSTASSDWDLPVRDNVVMDNLLSFESRLAGNSAILIEGGRSNVVDDNIVFNATYGVSVRQGQGFPPDPARMNVIRRNQISQVQTGLWVSGNLNLFEANLLEDTSNPVIDEGRNNTFADNVIN